MTYTNLTKGTIAETVQPDTVVTDSTKSTASDNTALSQIANQMQTKQELINENITLKEQLHECEEWKTELAVKNEELKELLHRAVAEIETHLSDRGDVDTCLEIIKDYQEVLK